MLSLMIKLFVLSHSGKLSAKLMELIASINNNRRSVMLLSSFIVYECRERMKIYLIYVLP